MSFTVLENQTTEEVKALVTDFVKILMKMKKIACRSKNYKEMVKRVKVIRTRTLLDVLEFRFRNSKELFSIGTMYSRRAYMDKLECSDLEDSDDEEYEEDSDQDYDDEEEVEETLSYDLGYDSDQTVDGYNYDDSVDEFRSRCKVQHLLSKIMWLRKGAKFVLDNIKYGGPEQFNLTPFRYLMMHRERVLCAIGGEYNQSFEVKYRFVKKGLDCIFIAHIFATEFERAIILRRIAKEDRALDDFITTSIVQP